MERIILLFLFLGFFTNIKAQSWSHLFEKNYGLEIVVKTDDIKNNICLHHKGVTIDHGSNESYLNLYVTEEGLTQISSSKIPFKLKKVVPQKIIMKTYDEIKKQHKGSDCMPPFVFYPSYEAYEQLMYDFEAQYPDMCRIVNIGTLSSGRKLLVAQIGDNIDVQENEPNFLYSSSMHGDELAGFPTMIKLIDHLLCNYGSDDQLTNLIDSVNIFINPLANPNGTYTNDNSTVNGARRENGSFVDLNRNYPDAKVGDNPDNRSYQEETLAFMQFSKDYNISLSCNIHGGAELANYPWDTFSQRHADNDWWFRVCREYIDTVHTHSPSGYLTDLNNGVSNGFDWFEAQGTRQDHITYFDRGREFTLEISRRKLLSTDDLPNIWEYNKNALVNYINESLYGLRGVVTDCDTGLPISAEIIMENHDLDNSSVFSSLQDGRYFRYLNEGNYVVTYISEGYDTLSQPHFIVDKSILINDVELCPTETSTTIESIELDLKFVQIGNKIKVITKNTDEDYKFYIHSISGQVIQKGRLIDLSITLKDNIPTGLYHVYLASARSSGSKTMLIK